MKFQDNPRSKTDKGKNSMQVPYYVFSTYFNNISLFDL